MKRKVTVRIGIWNRAKEFVKRIDSFDCEFDMEFGKTALEARSLNNLGAGFRLYEIGFDGPIRP